jgi:hypothetical protein
MLNYGMNYERKILEKKNVANFIWLANIAPAKA